MVNYVHQQIANIACLLFRPLFYNDTDESGENQNSEVVGRKNQNKF